MHNTGGQPIWNVQSTYGEEGLSFPSKPPPKILTSIAEHHSKFKPSNPPRVVKISNTSSLHLLKICLGI